MKHACSTVFDRRIPVGGGNTRHSLLDSHPPLHAPVGGLKALCDGARACGGLPNSSMELSVALWLTIGREKHLKSGEDVGK